MSIRPLTWLDPSRLGADAPQLFSRTLTLARVVADRLVDDVAGVVGGGVADDVDGGVSRDQPTDVVALSYRGVDYEVDLTQKQANDLDEALAPYLANARRATVKRTSIARPAVVASGSPDPREVRAWARTRGIVIADRGRVSADVLRRYPEAHSS